MFKAFKTLWWALNQKAGRASADDGSGILVGHGKAVAIEYGGGSLVCADRVELGIDNDNGSGSSGKYGAVRR